MTAGDGILCPICSGHTGVSQTQQLVGEILRRRHCLDRGCSGRVSTTERIVDDKPPKPPNTVLVSRRWLAQLRKLVGAIRLPAEEDETACASPDQSAIPVIEG